MWKIIITYSDKSKCTLTGKGKDISLELAIKYFNKYAANHVCSAKYQQYPKKIYKEKDLSEKIDELAEAEYCK